MSSEAVSLDTSVVMRLLVQKPAEQFQRAAAFLEECTERGREVHVPDLVLAESYFALQHHYRVPKPDALRALDAFVRESGLQFGNHVGPILALPGLAILKPGFVDRLIHGAEQVEGRSLVTFEKSAAKLPSALVL